MFRLLFILFDVTLHINLGLELFDERALNFLHRVWLVVDFVFDYVMQV